MLANGTSDVTPTDATTGDSAKAVLYMDEDRDGKEEIISVPVIMAPTEPQQESRMPLILATFGLAATLLITAFLCATAFYGPKRGGARKSRHLRPSLPIAEEDAPGGDETSFMLRPQNKQSKRTRALATDEVLECEAEWLRMDDDDEEEDASTAQPDDAIVAILDPPPIIPEPRSRSLAVKQALAEVNQSYQHLSRQPDKTDQT